MLLVLYLNIHKEFKEFIIIFKIAKAFIKVNMNYNLINFYAF
jgi:hypothetical protein